MAMSMLSSMMTTTMRKSAKIQREGNSALDWRKHVQRPPGSSVISSRKSIPSPTLANFRWIRSHSSSSAPYGGPTAARWLWKRTKRPQANATTPKLKKMNQRMTSSASWPSMKTNAPIREFT